MTKATRCAVEGCDGDHHRNGLCAKHHSEFATPVAGALRDYFDDVHRAVAAVAAVLILRREAIRRKLPAGARRT